MTYRLVRSLNKRTYLGKKQTYVSLEKYTKGLLMRQTEMDSKEITVNYLVLHEKGLSPKSERSYGKEIMTSTRLKENRFII